MWECANLLKDYITGPRGIESNLVGSPSFPVNKVYFNASNVFNVIIEQFTFICLKQ